MAIPGAERAIVTREKVCDYLLNLDHPDGWSKAIWIHALGYDRDNWNDLADDLREIAKTCGEFVTEATSFGIKFKTRGTVGRPHHRPGRVLAVWTVEPGEAPRLVTAYPDDTE